MVWEWRCFEDICTKGWPIDWFNESIIDKGVYSTARATPGLLINVDGYVALSDPGSMQFSHIIEQSPYNWESTMCQNVGLTIFHTHKYIS